MAVFAVAPVAVGVVTAAAAAAVVVAVVVVVVVRLLLLGAAADVSMDAGGSCRQVLSNSSRCGAFCSIFAVFK